MVGEISKMRPACKITAQLLRAGRVGISCPNVRFYADAPEHSILSNGAIVMWKKFQSH